MENIRERNILKIRTSILCIVSLMTISLFTSCENESDMSYGDSVPPPLPTNITQESAVPGGVIISYDVPTVVDLLYVQARYMVNGTERKSKSSSYENTLTVSGFGEVKEYDVWISSVDKSGNYSDEEKISVTPLTPQSDLSFESLKVDNAFGGIVVTFTNDSKADLIVETLVKDSLGFWQVLDSRATSSISEEYIIKDGIEFLDEAQEFKTYIKDRWGNGSDTLSRSLKPLFEEFFDFNHVTTEQNDDDDPSWPGANYYAKYLTDGIITNGNKYIYHSGAGTNFPVSLSIDLGVEAKISSYKMYPRYGYEYKNHCIKKWQIWARLDTPPETTEADPDFAPEDNLQIGDNYANIDGDTGWVLISQTYTTRPSGPDGPRATEDIAYGRAGEDHSIPIDIAKNKTFRYLKLCIQESYSNVHASIAELSFYGEYQEAKPE